MNSFKQLIILLLGVASYTSIASSRSADYDEGYLQAIVDTYFPETPTTLRYNQATKSLKVTVYSKLNIDKETELLKNRLGSLKMVKNSQIITQEDAPKRLERRGDANINKIFPNGTLFEAPIADPKWPVFGAAYQYHNNNNYGRSIFGLSFGENLAIFRDHNHEYAWEIGLQAGLFGALDMGSRPTRLINSDYMVGVNYTYLYKSWGNFFAFYHLSSHVGDEYLLSNRSVNRINLSYEALNWRSALEVGEFRPYLGVDYMVTKDPSYIKPFSYVVGIDYKADNTFINDTARLVGGAHLHSWQQNNYKVTFNVRGGVEFANPVWHGRSLKLLVDYAHGPSRQGQFYNFIQDYIGIMAVIST